MLGIFIFSGGQKDNHLSTKEMWNPSTGAPVYRAAMSEGRFSFLLACLRFDDPDTRQERQAMDKFAPIRKIWDIFIDNCKKLYVPGENITVDKQLLAFRGRCPFRMYIPNKPAKYGIKLVLANDVHSKYLLEGIPYLGKQVTQPQGGQSLGHYFTKELTKQYHQTNRNVTTDNWFTSVPLAIDLLEICGMTLVGTVKANKREIPHVMKENRTPGSSAFLFTKELTLLSFLSDAASKKKLVLLLSSMHTQPSIGPTHKPEVIEFYNQTKGGVDTFDQMCAQYG
ncbi:piggyBac transposable element-derived protein 4-like protein [Lates japonicus]|uniref:PiggyBac transposable element-derived protein 4-like protein n=1 Tax=Lates japonicus TaxID=270547 RepID=A0AAD3M2A8_LATJO|nr:piggyBac transposable element-derived protein 4-like protein [Lates japonicus]